MADFNNSERKPFVPNNVITGSNITLFNDEKKILKFTFNTSSFGIGIWSPVLSPEGKPTYPVEQRLNILIPHESSQALYHVLTNYIIPAISSGASAKFGVFTNWQKNNMLQFIVNEGKVTMRYLMGLDQDRNPTEIYVYEFTQLPIVKNFEPGESAHELLVHHASFFLMYHCLSSFLQIAIWGSVPHSIDQIKKHIHDKYVEALKGIAEKNGVQIDWPAVYNAVNNGTPITNNTPVVSTPSVPTSSPVINELTDINQLLA
jgi:hypothetical protein